MPRSQFLTQHDGDMALISEACQRFEEWLLSLGYESTEDHPYAPSATEAYGLVGDFLTDTPRYSDHLKALQSHAAEIGELYKPERD
ncbi:unnamed protein product [Gemmata massiliana]|uniref:Uncharacterized protein n=1 Tax=Gemmata massiliana TaxID=1210884 RepID=A0A6P2D819_9BACT|nr:unnamed protein product [Gemmata massiliana]